MAELQLANENNWRNIWNESFTATPVANNPDRYVPFPELDLPILLQSNIIAVNAYSTTASPYWKFAGLVKQKLQLGLTVGGGADAVGVKIRKIWLNQITLIEFDKLSDTFAVSFKIPYWIDQINLTVWEYTGPQNKVDSFHTSLLEEINSKIDDLQTN